jgi:putative N6-adenine-specific DNA methylase
MVNTSLSAEPLPLPTFFLSVPPAFIDLAAMELRYWVSYLAKDNAFDLSSLQILRDGLQVQLPLGIGYDLNHYLKIPNRILLRRDEFRVRDFPKLYNRLRRINWGPFCTGESIQWHVSTHGSRLSIKTKIKETCEKAYTAYRKAQPAGKPTHSQSQNIFIRLVDDNCTVSIDTSGEHLHRRGYRQWVTEAPLRENLAAAVLLKMIAVEGRPAVPVTLIDPMMGSGTILAEAALLSLPSPRRDFSFLHFKGAFRYQSSPLLNPKDPLVENLYGGDRDAKAVDACRHNLQNLSIQNVQWSIHQQDLLKTNQMIMPENRPLWLACNPPYGKRLESQWSDRKTLQQLKLFIKKSSEHWQPNLMAWVLPCIEEHGLTPVGYDLISRTNFKNGGIPVIVIIWKKRHGHKLQR